MWYDGLKEKALWEAFEEISRIPRESGNEEGIRQWLLSWAKERGLKADKDKVGNVFIYVPASEGREKEEALCLQGHMDMVCVKTEDSSHDFTKDPIEILCDGKTVRAKDTTLGADNGIAIAMALALAQDKECSHPALELLFTVSEETGLTGAFGMQPGFMSGDYLLNLDSEDEGQIFVSCAGGARTEAEFSFEPIAAPAGYFFFEIKIKGLTGGHSGDDINKKRANANKLLSRFLYQSYRKYDLYLCDIQAGGLHNAIPREAAAVCAIPMKDKESIRVDWNLFSADVEEEYRVTEPHMEFLLQSESARPQAVERSVAQKLIWALQAVYNGILSMSQDIDLVETSSNLASIKLVDGNRIVVNSSQRSSILSARHNMSDTIQAVFELAGAKVEVGEGYPGWKMNPHSEILRIAVETYRELFDAEPKVLGIHAGLECGLFSETYPGLDMISFGPTLRGVHSPDERLLVPTVAKVWNHLKAILERIPEKA